MAAAAKEQLDLELFIALGWTRHEIAKSSDGLEIYERLWYPAHLKPPGTNAELQEHCELRPLRYSSDLNIIVKAVDELKDTPQYQQFSHELAFRCQWQMNLAIQASAELRAQVLLEVLRKNPSLPAEKCPHDVPYRWNCEKCDGEHGDPAAEEETKCVMPTLE